MFGRRVTEAIRPGVVSLERNSVRNDEKRMEDGYGHAREAFGHASHHEDALVAINRHWCLRRTARHIVCHLVHHGRCRHFIRHRRHRSLRWCPRHDRPGNRRHDKARDHQDREQPTYGEIAVHGIKFSQTSGDKKATSLKVMELYLSCIDRYQVANKFERGPNAAIRRCSSYFRFSSAPWLGLIFEYAPAHRKPYEFREAGRLHLVITFAR